MEPDALAPLKAILVGMRDELRGAGDVRLESERGDDTVHKPDEDAAPLAEMNQVIASSRNRARTARLREIEAALQRMADDPEEFGLCDDCGEPIPPRRLQLMPWTRLCIECQSTREDDGPGVGRRRHLTDYE